MPKPIIYNFECLVMQSPGYYAVSVCICWMAGSASNFPTWHMHTHAHTRTHRHPSRPRSMFFYNHKTLQMISSQRMVSSPVDVAMSQLDKKLNSPQAVRVSAVFASSWRNSSHRAQKPNAGDVGNSVVDESFEWLLHIITCKLHHARGRASEQAIERESFRNVTVRPGAGDENAKRANSSCLRRKSYGMNAIWY